MSDKGRYALYIVLIYLLFIIFFHQQKEQKISELLKTSIIECRNQLNSSQNAFDKLSMNFFNEHNDYLSMILDKVIHTNKKQKHDRFRSTLLDRLYPIYKSASLLGLKQFQIFDRKGKSFLRFENEKIYGDPVIKKRPSLQIVYSDKIFLNGFEAGRFEEGLRYIYPLFHNGNFVGAYEWVWSDHALLGEIKKIFGGFNRIIFKSRYLRKYMDSYYIDKHFAFFDMDKNYMYHKEALDSFLKEFLQYAEKNEKLKKHLETASSYSFVYDKKKRKYLVTFLSLRSIGNEEYGYLINIQIDTKSENIVLIYHIEILFSTIMMFLLSILIYKNYEEKIYIKRLIDSQKDIVVLTNGNKAKDVNRAFLNFFNISSLKEFKKRHDCICDLFEEQTGFITKKTEGRNWLEYIIANDMDEHHVLMYDKNKKEDRIFSISVNTFDDRGNYVISFRDVTELEKERRMLHIKSLIDHMTDTYNKMAFEEYLTQLLLKIKIDNKIEYALIMFDIDKFKNINDNYGHTRGDDTIKELVNLIQGSIRKSDFMARWGGDEFVIVLNEIGSFEALGVTEKIRGKIALNRFSINRQVTCSFGITMLNPKDTVDSAMDRVDKLLYRAKRNGRNRTESDFSQT